MKKQAYISMTGVQTLEQAQLLNAKLSKYKVPRAHRPVIGILTSPKSFKDEEGPRKQPGYKELPNILATLKPVADLALHHYTPRPDTLAQEFIAGAQALYETGLITLVQYNNTKPDPRQLEQVKKAFPALEQIISITPAMYEQSSWRDNKAFISDYNGLADHVIIDPSGGNHKPLNLHQSLRWHLTIRENMDATTCFAGGLNPQNVAQRLQDLGSVIVTMDEVSIDAEKGLQDIKGAFVPKKAGTFYAKAQQAFSQQGSRYKNNR